ncbi:MAG: hypothetical protein A3F16_03465 [Deltaproteobacteria bacterium RIFCSPHIGHO2_12_FULL_43_9]|nr:MAG: hypothetical protein A3F16_03465 [Deltaproteobacteria bacterium RIFCSPHIGHO2_12_FULL_43_9]
MLSLFVISFSLFLPSISYSQVAEDTFTGETLDDAAVDEAGELPEEIPPPPEEPPLSPPPKKSGLQAITVQQQLERLGETPPTPKSKFEPPTMASPEIKPTPKLEIPPTAGEPDIAPLPLPEPTIVRQVPLPVPAPRSAVVNKSFDAPPMPPLDTAPPPPRGEGLYTPPIFKRGTGVNPLLYNKQALNFLPILDPILNPPLPIEIPPEGETVITPEGRVELAPTEPLPSRITHGIYLLGTSYKPPNLTLPNGLFRFQYDSAPVLAETTFELYLLTGWFGTIGYRGNFLFFLIDGSQWSGSPLQLEDMDLYIVGINGSIAYHAEFFDNQFFIPWAEFGFGQNLYYQSSDDVAGGVADFKEIRNIWFYSVGGKLLIDWLDPRGAKRLDSRWGINHTYLMGMFRQYFSDGGAFNFSGLTGLAGINIEF